MVASSGSRRARLEAIAAIALSYNEPLSDGKHTGKTDVSYACDSAQGVSISRLTGLVLARMHFARSQAA